MQAVQQITKQFQRKSVSGPTYKHPNTVKNVTDTFREFFSLVAPIFVILNTSPSITSKDFADDNDSILIVVA